LSDTSMGVSVDQSMAQAMRGDKDALTALLLQYGPQVRSRLAGKMPARWQSMLDEDDVLQVTYLEAFLRIGQFSPAEDDPGGSFLAWLTRIAENNLRDAVKWLDRKKRPPPTPGGDGLDAEQSLIETLTGGLPTPSRQVGHAELRALLAAALGELPPDYAEVIRLYDLAGCPIDEVAARLKRSTGAVFMLRARAHDRLQELLGSSSQYFSGAS